jgi:predicted MFS family arabinose efflux permease
MRETNPGMTSVEDGIRYPGWSVAGAAFVGVMTSFAPIIPYTFSLFLNPLHAAFGWKRAAMDGTFATAAITVALVSPFIGMLLDRFPPRRIILPAILIFALALASLSRLSGSIGEFYLIFFVMGLAANGTAQFAYTRTILTWFQKRRGFALALILTGSGMGSVLIPPVTQWVIAHHGWRDAYLLLGGIALLGLPLTALLVRNRPAAVAVPDAVAVSNDELGATSLSVRGAFSTLAFWILCAITVLSAFSENGLVTNLAAILTDHGVAAQSAALVLSVRGGAGILGRLGVGFLIDRFSPQRIQTIILILAAIGTLILAFAGSPAVALLGSVLLGVGLGSESDLLPYMLAHYVGRKHFSVLYGLTWTAYAIGGATGPMFIGHMYDAAGAYHYQPLVMLAVVATGAAGLTLLLPRKPGSGFAGRGEIFVASPISLEE